MSGNASGRPLRVGIVGAGRIVERVHLPTVGGRPDTSAVGIYDPEAARARELAGRFGVEHVCGELDELLRLDLDAVIVASPNATHAQTCVAALRSGAHVLCEKPLATSAAEAEAMVRAAEESGRELMAAFANRFRPEVAALRTAMREMGLGGVEGVRCGWLRRNGVPGAGTWFTRRALSGGGVLIDLGSHLLDLAVWLSGRPRLLRAACVLDRTAAPGAQAAWYTAAGAPDAPDLDVDVTASGFAVFEGPLNLFVEVSWASNVPFDQTYFQLSGRGWMARLDTLFGFSPNGQRPENPLRLWVGGEPVPTEAAAAGDVFQPFRDQWDFFVESLRGGRSLRAGLHDALATARVVEAMYESAAEFDSAPGAASGVSEGQTF
ncbi:MAG TPA: Gfo/Idh/MocA family oxidoreductase [Pyrinomonadaceae bacterium]|jgi:predicted dehydrogenase